MTFCKQIADQGPQLFNQQDLEKVKEYPQAVTRNLGVLCLVSTPIGHLKDLTFRALETLQSADIIVCEDTRVTRTLLSSYEISPPHLWTYHEHNGEQQRPKILEALSQGKLIALVSDAGTPLISDPGFKLVKAAQDRGIQVTAAPGVSAVTTALSLSGLATNEFYFSGFIPRKSGERQRLFKSLSTLSATLIFYESTRRVVASLEEMRPYFQGREVAMARELTKRFEEIVRRPIDLLISELKERPSLKGELVLLVGPPSAHEICPKTLEKALHKALETQTLKEAVTFVSQNLNLSRKQVYQKALEMKEGSGGKAE